MFKIFLSFVFGVGDVGLFDQGRDIGVAQIMEVDLFVVR